MVAKFVAVLVFNSGAAANDEHPLNMLEQVDNDPLVLTVTCCKEEADAKNPLIFVRPDLKIAALCKLRGHGADPGEEKDMVVNEPAMTISSHGVVIGVNGRPCCLKSACVRLSPSVVGVTTTIDVLCPPVVTVLAKVA